MNFRHRWGHALLCVSVILACTTIWAASAAKRAKPPHFGKSANDVFFADAREKLFGERPAAGTKGPTPGGPTGGDTPAGGGEPGGVFAWSKLIGAEELEDEIKTMQKEFSANVTVRGPFVGGGYKVARRQLTELALLFGIIAEYDGDVRWKKDAPSMRDLVARTGFNCKVGTDASYNESKLRKDELETLIRGGSGPTVAGVEANAPWEKVVGRPPLMQRLEMAQQQGVAILTSNAADFTKNQEKVLKEAEMIAVIAEVIQRPGFEFADDETYLGFAKQMRDAAVTVAEAAKTKNYEAARAASGKIDKACSQCHEGYRS